METFVVPGLLALDGSQVKQVPNGAATPLRKQKFSGCGVLGTVRLNTYVATLVDVEVDGATLAGVNDVLLSATPQGEPVKGVAVPPLMVAGTRRGVEPAVHVVAAPMF